MDPIDIANLGLGWLGVKPITSLDDPLPAAVKVKGAFDGLRDSVLEDEDWTFATDRLQLAADPVAPAFGYTSRYSIPSDVLRVITVESTGGSGLDAFALSMNPAEASDPLDWQVESGKNSEGARGRYIVADTDAAAVNVRAIARIEDSSLWTPGFCQALAARLAADLCVPITQDRALSADMWKLYVAKLEVARGSDARQGRSRVFRANTLANRRR